MEGLKGRRSFVALLVCSALLLISTDTVSGKRLARQWGKSAEGERRKRDFLCRLPKSVVRSEDGTWIHLERGVPVDLKSYGCIKHGYENVRHKESEKNNGITGAVKSFITGASDSIASLWKGKKAQAVDSDHQNGVITSFFTGARDSIASLWDGKKKVQAVDGNSQHATMRAADSVLTKFRKSIESWKHPGSFPSTVTSATEAVEFPTDPSQTRVHLMVSPKFHAITTEVVQEYRTATSNGRPVDSCLGALELQVKFLFKTLKFKLMEQCNSEDGSASLLDQNFCAFFKSYSRVVVQMMFAKNGISPVEEGAMRIRSIAPCSSESEGEWRHSLHQLERLAHHVASGHTRMLRLEQHRSEDHEHTHEHEHSEPKEHEHERMGQIRWNRLRAAFLPTLEVSPNMHRNRGLHDHHELQHDSLLPQDHVKEHSCQDCFTRQIIQIEERFHVGMRRKCEFAVCPKVIAACNLAHKHKLLMYTSLIKTIRPWEFAASECAQTCASSPSPMFLVGSQNVRMGPELRPVSRVAHENWQHPRFAEKSAMVGESKSDLVGSDHGHNHHRPLPSLSSHQMQGRHSCNGHVKKLVRTLSLRRPTVHMLKSEGGSGVEGSVWTELVVFSRQPYGSSYLRDPFLHNVRLAGVARSSESAILSDLKNDITLKPVFQHLKDLDVMEAIQRERQFVSALIDSADAGHWDTASHVLDGQEAAHIKKITDSSDGQAQAVDLSQSSLDSIEVLDQQGTADGNEGGRAVM